MNIKNYYNLFINEKLTTNTIFQQLILVFTYEIYMDSFNIFSYIEI